MPLVSVIVPVYNSEMYLSKCVDSILNQSFRNFELILVDDGSTDNSGYLCEQYSKLDKRVKVIRQENKKQGAARNAGVRIASSDLIAFIDSDDIVSNLYLEKLYDVYLETKCIVVCCNFIEGTTDYIFKDCKSISKRVLEMNEHNMLTLRGDKNYFWISCCKLIQKDLLLKFPFPEGIFYEDNAIVFEWLYHAKRIACLDEILYFYRKNQSSTTKGSNLHIFDYLKALETQVDFFHSVSFSKLANVALDEQIKLASHLFFKYKKDPKSKIYLKKEITRIVKKYEDYLDFEAVYGNRVIHPFISFFVRISRRIKLLNKKPKPKY